MENRFIVRDILRGSHEAFHPSELVWYIWDRKLEQLSLAYYLTQEKAQQMCDRKNKNELVT